MIQEYLELNFDAKNHMGRNPRNNEDYVAFHIPSIKSERVAQGCLFLEAVWVVIETWDIANLIEYACQLAVSVGADQTTAFVAVDSERDVFIDRLDGSRFGNVMH